MRACCPSVMSRKGELLLPSVSSSVRCADVSYRSVARVLVAMWAGLSGSITYFLSRNGCSIFAKLCGVSSVSSLDPLWVSLSICTVPSSTFFTFRAIEEVLDKGIYPEVPESYSRLRSCVAHFVLWSFQVGAFVGAAHTLIAVIHGCGRLGVPRQSAVALGILGYLNVLIIRIRGSARFLKTLTDLWNGLFEEGSARISRKGIFVLAVASLSSFFYSLSLTDSTYESIEQVLRWASFPEGSASSSLSFVGGVFAALNTFPFALCWISKGVSELMFGLKDKSGHSWRLVSVFSLILSLPYVSTIFGILFSQKDPHMAAKMPYSNYMFCGAAVSFALLAHLPAISSILLDMWLFLKEQKKELPMDQKQNFV